MARFTNLSQQTINGTSIGAVTISTTVGSWNYISEGTCNAPLALLTTLPAILFTRYGVQLAHKISSKHLSLVVGTAMLASTPLIVLKNHERFRQWSKNDHKNPLDLQFYDKTTEFGMHLEKLPEFLGTNSKYLVAGSFAGFISGLCGLGGGILMTAYLTAASEMPQPMIIGTSLLSIVPTAASSTYFNIKAKSIHLPTAAKIGVSLTAGVYLTSKYVTHHVPEDTLRGILAGALSGAALTMMRRAL